MSCRSLGRSRWLPAARADSAGNGGRPGEAETSCAAGAARQWLALQSTNFAPAVCDEDMLCDVSNPDDVQATVDRRSRVTDRSTSSSMQESHQPAIEEHSLRKFNMILQINLTERFFSQRAGRRNAQTPQRQYIINVVDRRLRGSDGRAAHCRIRRSRGGLIAMPQESPPWARRGAELTRSRRGFPSRMTESSGGISTSMGPRPDGEQRRGRVERHGSVWRPRLGYHRHTIVIGGGGRWFRNSVPGDNSEARCERFAGVPATLRSRAALP